MTTNTPKISFIGFGEAAQAFARGLSQESAPVELHAFDIKTDGPGATAKQTEYTAYGVTGAATCAQACAGARMIFSFVTAEQAERAAMSAAQSDLNGALFLDCNSCAPNTKRRSAQVIEAAGGRYVDVAVMTPVHPRLHKSPSLLAGPHAKHTHAITQQLGMNADVAGEDIGDASTRKMIRSVMIKGLEALTLECFLAAREAGIESDILATLEEGYPGFDWKRRAPYMLERIATHGIRRAAEMDEVAQTLRDLGVDPHMTERTVIRQREVGELGLEVSDDDATNLAKLADTIMAGLKPSNPKENDTWP